MSLFRVFFRWFCDSLCYFSCLYVVLSFFCSFVSAISFCISVYVAVVRDFIFVGLPVFLCLCMLCLCLLVCSTFLNAFLFFPSAFLSDSLSGFKYLFLSVGLLLLFMRFVMCVSAVLVLFGVCLSVVFPLALYVLIVFVCSCRV